MLLISSILILLGALFVLIAALGVYRFQDIYLKMHAATKAGTMGVGLILCGSLFRFDSLKGITELLLLIIFIVITNPISAHLIAKTLHLQHDE